MMFEKICIASNGTGMADYVEHGKNGFIYQASNVEELSHYMSYIIQNIEELGDMKREARKTYEAYFSMDVFRKRLDRIIKDITNNYEYNDEIFGF